MAGGIADNGTRFRIVAERHETGRTLVMATAIPNKTAAKKQAKPKAAPAVKPSAALGLRRRLQLSQAVFARLLPVSVRSLATLEGGAAPTEAVARRLAELRRLTDALAEAMKEDSLGAWLQTPNAAFDGLKPLEVIDRGEGDRIWAMLYFLRSGVPA
jgi:DNA-binding transcriptional regulator YiaG